MRPGKRTANSTRSAEPLFDDGVFDVLAGGEDLIEEHAELDFGEAAAGFDVGEDAGEAVDAFGELGHFAEAGVDFVELIGDLAEGFGEAGVQGGVEFFVYGGAHLFELGGVVFVECGEAVFHAGAELVLMGGVAAHELDELGVEGFLQRGVFLAGLVFEFGEALRDGAHLLIDFGA